MKITKTTLYTILLLTALPASTMADWEKLPSVPESNGGFACGTSGDGIVVMGGTNWVDGEKLWLDSVRRFDPKNQQWNTLESLPRALAYGPFAHHDGSGSLIVLGGSDGETPRLTIVTVADGDITTRPEPALPDEVVLSAGGIIGDQFLVVGGTDDAANIAGMTTRTFSVDLKNDTVSNLPDYPGKPFAISASIAVGKELFVFGGANWDANTETVSNTIECYAFSIETKVWRKLKNSPLDLRGHAAVALDEHRIYIAGGYGGEPAGFLSTAFIYDVRSDTYTKAKPLPYAATAGLVVLDGYLYCIGGEDEMKSRTDQMWKIRVKELTPAKAE